MSEAVRKHRLAFRQAHLEPVLSGRKTATIRFSKVAARVKPGDTLTLAFGNRMKPEILTAAAARVDHFDLTEQLEQMRKIDAELDNLTEQEEAEMDAAEVVMETWTPEDHRQFLLSDGVPAELLDALEAAGGDYNGVLLEADDRGLNVCTAVWWQGVRRGG